TQQDLPISAHPDARHARRTLPGREGQPDSRGALPDTPRTGSLADRFAGCARLSRPRASAALDPASLVQRPGAGMAYLPPAAGGLLCADGIRTDHRVATAASRPLAAIRRAQATDCACSATDGNDMSQPTLSIATACLFDEQGRILLVRKRGTHYFMLPGGKAEAGETPLMTVKRELFEELAVELDDADLQWLGHFQAPAANEPGHWVDAQVFVGKANESVRAQAEIEETAWLDLTAPNSHRLAPLLREKILPVLSERIATTH